jgi:hypothetical protein
MSRASRGGFLRGKVQAPRSHHTLRTSSDHSFFLKNYEKKESGYVRISSLKSKDTYAYSVLNVQLDRA